MHDVRPLECERTRHFVSVSLDGSLSRFERELVRAHLARCAACRAYERGVTDVTLALRSAPLERLSTPVRLPSRRTAAWRTVARATSVVAAASVAVAAFVGFAGADRSAWQDDHALIAAALDRPAGTNDLLIDVVRPVLAAHGQQASEAASGGLGAVKPLLLPGA